MIFVHGSLTWVLIDATKKEVAGRLFQLKAKPMAASDTALAFGVAEKKLSEVHWVVEEVSRYNIYSLCACAGMPRAWGRRTKWAFGLVAGRSGEPLHFFRGTAAHEHGHRQ